MSFCSLATDSRGASCIEVHNTAAWERHIYAWKEYDGSAGSAGNWATDIELKLGTTGSGSSFLELCASGMRTCDRLNPAPGSPNEFIFVRYDDAKQCGLAGVVTSQYPTGANFTEIFSLDLGTTKFCHWRVRLNAHQSVRIVIIIENDNAGRD